MNAVALAEERPAGPFGLGAALQAGFSAQFDPALEGDRAAAVLSLTEAFHLALEGVSSIEDDRTLRRLLELIRGTVRTNYFQTAEDGNPKPYISIKLDSAQLREVPLPKPKYSTRHARSGTT